MTKRHGAATMAGRGLGGAAALLWLGVLALPISPGERDDPFIGGMSPDHAREVHDPWSSHEMCGGGTFAADVVLAITGSTDVYALGGPIDLTGRIFNVSPRRIVYYSASQWVNFDVRAMHEGGTEPSLIPFVALLRHFGSRGRTRNVIHTLEHGESGDDALDLNDWFEFKLPGKYRVVAARWISFFDESSARWASEVVQSNVLSIELRADLAVCSKEGGP